MKKFISFCAFLLIFTLPIMADDSNGTGNGSYQSDIYCTPTFSVSGISVDGSGRQGANSYTQFLGNYFLGYVGNVNNLNIIFTLTGPGKIGETPIDYSVVRTASTGYDVSGATFVVNWFVTNAMYPNGHQLGGEPNYGGTGSSTYLHLLQDQVNNCLSYATLTIRSISIDLTGVTVSDGTMPKDVTFSISLTACATI